ncbi:hypothetical protein M440DRAFT_1394122 [Trichoderma longibrachiatum ATCC 18648]|uniref:Uncharacterized protein n=1 Tax=Trichoderma longibrachiatum ATCC 18648 TaxID=983965 RepID=A0A2T4BWC0_TRILO|nr:hypothetical protein M440DRAFT_1394122 [Trichoderma longibrachiatum ATCC 18648]
MSVTMRIAKRIQEDVEHPYRSYGRRDDTIGESRYTTNYQQKTFDSIPEVWYSQTLQQHQILLWWDTNSPSLAKGTVTLNNGLVLLYMQEAFDNRYLPLSRY